MLLFVNHVDMNVTYYYSQSLMYACIVVGTTATARKSYSITNYETRTTNVFILFRG
jgi:hypothetical protein